MHTNDRSLRLFHLQLQHSCCRLWLLFVVRCFWLGLLGGVAWFACFSWFASKTVERGASFGYFDDGKMVKDKWVTGLNSPKGLRSHDGTLWVSDIDQIVSIDISRGNITQTVKVPDAEFLNDLACGPDGSVYVADMLPSRIYQYKDSKISVLAEGEQVESPNGLLVNGGKLIIAAWGHDIQDDFSTKTCLLYTSPSPRDGLLARMPSSA